MNGSAAVVIVAHDSGELLVECVERTMSASDVGEILVVDNGSTDGFVDRLRPLAPRVAVLRNANNPGFAVACNQGAAATRALWILFLNPDCLIDRDTVARLLALAESDPAIGLVGADVRDAEGRREDAARRRDPDLRAAARRAFGMRGGEAAYGDVSTKPDRREVDAVSGALMLVRRSVFEAIGGFDEAYRLHCEDLDLCRRVREQGAKVVVAEQVTVTHLKGTSSRRKPWFVLWHKHRGMWRYYRKFDGRRDSLPRRAFVALGWAGYTVVAFARLAGRRLTGRA